MVKIKDLTYVHTFYNRGHVAPIKVSCLQVPALDVAEEYPLTLVVKRETDNVTQIVLINDRFVRRILVILIRKMDRLDSRHLGEHQELLVI